MLTLAVWLAVAFGDPVPPAWTVFMEMQDDGPMMVIENREGC